MQKDEIQNLIKDIIEKTNVKINQIISTTEGPKNIWISVEVNEPHFFISHDGEGLQALNHLVHRIIESKNPHKFDPENPTAKPLWEGILIDINGFQKKRVESIRAIAHMMSERARYFKSNIEVDPMSSFDRRIVHEFLADAMDLKTESIGVGRDRRVVIKYVGIL